MNGIVKTLAAAAVALSFAGPALHAEEPTPAELAETQARVKVASGIIGLGRAEKDPMMLVVGARILSGIGGVGGADEASAAYDVPTILAEARELAGDDQYLLDAIAAVPADRAERSGERYCNWYENCGYSIVDPFACEWVQVCN